MDDPKSHDLCNRSQWMTQKVMTQKVMTSAKEVD
jgi:hypothetical protein